VKTIADGINGAAEGARLEAEKGKAVTVQLEKARSDMLGIGGKH